MTSTLRLALLVLTSTLAASPAWAQADRYALLVEGASGEPQYAELHRGWLDRLVTVLVDRFAFDPAHIIVLAEQPQPGELRATADSLTEAMGRLASEVGEEDLLFVMLIGHGSGQGDDAKFNLVGRDLDVAEWNALLAPIPGRLAFVNATSSSYPYLTGLAGPNRVIITATRTAAQRYHTHFGGAFITALAAEEADLNQNGRTSLLEAFSHASRLVEQEFEGSLMQTENAMLDDTGDGQGRDAATEGDDGALASRTYLDAGISIAMASADPALRPLLERQADLTAQVEELIGRRRLLPDDFYASEFERLMIELSLVSRDVRRQSADQP